MINTYIHQWFITLHWRICIILLLTKTCIIKVFSVLQNLHEKDIDEHFNV